jgi:hypothetical protein
VIFARSKAIGGPTVEFADEPQEGEAEKDECSADERAFKVAGVAVDEDSGSAENEDGGKNGISPDAVWAN